MINGRKNVKYEISSKTGVLNNFRRYQLIHVNFHFILLLNMQEGVFPLILFLTVSAKVKKSCITLLWSFEL